MLDATYAALHWGDKPSGEQDIYVAVGHGTPVAELAAISYVATKGGSPEVFIHEFKKIQGRYPYLLELTSQRTEYSLPDFGSSRKTASLGPVIDMHTVDGKTIFAPMYVVCTTDASLTDRGGPLLLGSRFQPSYGIERRKGCPYIREHGIIH
jgi:hypothetical protein